MALSTLRAELKTAITDNTKYSAYDHVPEVIIPPSVLILAGDPYLEPIVIGNNKNWNVRLTLEVVGTVYSNPSALTNLEDDIEAICALIPTKWSILSVSSPRIRATNSTDLLSSEIQITTVYTG
jgi:hypothetical protein